MRVRFFVFCVFFGDAQDYAVSSLLFARLLGLQLLAVYVYVYVCVCLCVCPCILYLIGVQQQLYPFSDWLPLAAFVWWFVLGVFFFSTISY